MDRPTAPGRKGREAQVVKGLVRQSQEKVREGRFDKCGEKKSK